MSTPEPRPSRQMAMIAAGSLAAVLVLGSGIAIGRMQPTASEGPAPAALPPMSAQQVPTTTNTAPVRPLITRPPVPSASTLPPAPTAPASTPTADAVVLPPADPAPVQEAPVEAFNPPPITYPTTPECPKAGVKVGVTGVQYHRTVGLYDFYRTTLTIENTTGMPIAPRTSAGIVFRYGTEKRDWSGGLITLPQKLPPGRTVFTSKDPDEELGFSNLMEVPVTSVLIEGPVEFGNTDGDYNATSRYCTWTAKTGEPLRGSWGN